MKLWLSDFSATVLFVVACYLLSILAYGLTY